MHVGYLFVDLLADVVLDPLDELRAVFVLRVGHLFFDFLGRGVVDEVPGV